MTTWRRFQDQELPLQLANWYQPGSAELYPFDEDWTATAEITLRNVTVAELDTTKVTLSATSPSVTIAPPTGFFADLEPDVYRVRVIALHADSDKRDVFYEGAEGNLPTLEVLAVSETS